LSKEEQAREKRKAQEKALDQEIDPSKIRRKKKGKKGGGVKHQLDEAESLIRDMTGTLSALLSICKDLLAKEGIDVDDNDFNAKGFFYRWRVSHAKHALESAKKFMKGR